MTGAASRQAADRSNFGARKVNRTAMMLAAALAMLVSSTTCNAQAKCPWLNAATAAGFLGGEVQLSVSSPVDPGPVKGVGQASYEDQVRMDRFDVTCQFTRKTASDTYTLRIVVKTMADQSRDYPGVLAQCAGATVTLKGIGNEAVQCRPASSAHQGQEQFQEQVISRVRDRSFVLLVHRDGSAGDQLRDDTRNIAEQIAGSLF